MKEKITNWWMKMNWWKSRHRIATEVLEKKIEDAFIHPENWDDLPDEVKDRIAFERTMEISVVSKIQIRICLIRGFHKQIKKRKHKQGLMLCAVIGMLLFGGGLPFALQLKILTVAVLVPWIIKIQLTIRNYNDAIVKEYKEK